MVSNPVRGCPCRCVPRVGWLESGVFDGAKPVHMMAENANGAGPFRADPRAAALSRYLRRTAAVFSMSADATNSPSTADLGMALLDAARIAEAMPSADPRIRVLSEAHLFESMPEGKAVFIEVAEIRRAVRRTLVSGPQDGASIIAELITTACELTGASGRQPRRALGQDEAAGIPARAPDWHEQRSPLPLSALFEAVDAARARMQACRAGQPTTEREAKRRDLVLALQAYVKALEAWPVPVPYNLRAELLLHQGLLHGPR